jgi:hypothetical protein
MPKYAFNALCPRAGFVSRQYRKASLLLQAIRISSPSTRKNIPLKLHTGRTSDGSVETEQAIIEGTTYDIQWKLSIAVTLLQICAMLEDG